MGADLPVNSLLWVYRHPSVRSSCLIDLRWFAHDNLSLASTRFDLSTHANTLAVIVNLRRSELRPIPTECLSWKRISSMLRSRRRKYSLQCAGLRSASSGSYSLLHRRPELVARRSRMEVVIILIFTLPVRHYSRPHGLASFPTPPSTSSTSNPRHSLPRFVLWNDLRSHPVSPAQPERCAVCL